MNSPTFRMPLRHTMRFTAAAVAVIGGACNGNSSRAAPAWQTVVDTIRDTVVVRTHSASDSATALALTPELRIGEFEGSDEYTFATVGAVIPTATGGVYVWDRTLRNLRQYDSSGVFVRQVGRRGSGPGEYEEVNGLVLLPSGELLLWDPRNARVNRYDSAGTFVESWSYRSRLFTSKSVVLDTAGRVYLPDWFPRRTASGAARDGNEALVRLTASGRVLDSLRPPVVDGEPVVVRASRDGRTAVSQVPYIGRSSWAMSPLGYFVSSAPDAFAITLHRTHALPLRIERNLARVAVESDEAADLEEAITARMRRVDPGWTWTGVTIPDHKPHLQGLAVGLDGRVWAARYVAGERSSARADQAVGRSGEAAPSRRWNEPTVFDVFEPDGRMVGSLRIPTELTLLTMRGDKVWGVERDADDVPHVTRWRISSAEEANRSGGVVGGR